MNTNEISKGTALITGASAGIGAVYADRLVARGYDVILVARNQERLESVRSQLAAKSPRSVTLLKADLNDPADVARVEAVLRDDASITMLVNNAGVGSVAPLLKSDVDAMQRMIDINVTALTRLTYAVAPKFVERGNGTIINIASAVALRPELLNGVYGASKAFVLALSQSLQHELTDKGVRTQAVLPAATATEFWELSGSPGMPSYAMNVNAMVDAALTGLDQGELVTIPPLQDGELWLSYDASRREMAKGFGQSQPASRYLVS